MRWSLAFVALLLGLLPLRILALGSPSSAPAWANPAQMTLKNAVPAHIPDRYHTAQTENLPCQDETHAQASSGTMTGCFIQTAYGEQDSESSTAIFAGTSGKALPVTPVIGGQVLLGWPGADTVLALTTISTGGVQVGMYRFFTSVITDQTNVLGQVTGKRITKTADLTLTDASGRALLFNPNTLAFSDHGSWLVGETLNNGFVRVNLATLNVVSFAPAYASLGGTPGLSESQLAITDDGRFVAVANQTATTSRVYDLNSCSGVVCDSFNYWSFLAGQLPTNFVPVHLRFLNDGLLSFHGNSGLLEATYLLAPTDRIDSLLSYLGLGDSVASGEGAYQYRFGTDGGGNLCHLSDVSYPLLTTRALFTSSAGNSVACSGAKIGDIAPLDASDYTGQAGIGTALSERSSDSMRNLFATFSAGYIPQSLFVGTYQPGLVTVEIGGNDIGFRDIITECAMLHISGGNSCYNSYEDRLELANLIDQTMPKLTRLYRDLKAASPLGKLYVVGYPEIVTPGDCADNVHLDAKEVQLAGFLNHQLNAAIAEATRQAGVSYIDVTQALAGHRLCETNSSVAAVNGLTAGSDTGIKLPGALGSGNLRFLSNGSYHPNAYGQQLLEQAVRATLQSVIQPVTTSYNPAATDISGLLAATKTNRPVASLSFASLTEANVTGAGRVTLTFHGLGAGLRPNTDYTLRLDGSGGSVLGTVHSDANTSISGSVIAPPATDTPTVHTIDLVGPNQAGDLSDVRQVITVSPPEPPVTTATPTAGSTTNTVEPPASLEQTTLVADVLSLPLDGSSPESSSGQNVLGTTTINPQSGSQSKQQLHSISKSGQPERQPRPKLPVIGWLVYLYILLLFWVFYVIGRLSSDRRQFA
jgi:lysophospholipase L1-like esterase